MPAQPQSTAMYNPQVNNPHSQRFHYAAMPPTYLHSHLNINLGGFLGGSPHPSAGLHDHELYQYSSGAEVSCELSHSSLGAGVSGATGISEPSIAGSVAASVNSAAQYIGGTSPSQWMHSHVVSNPHRESLPPAMAVTFNSPPVSANFPTSAAALPLSGTEPYHAAITNTARPPANDTDRPAAQPTQNSSTRAREKKHGCWMCHKSFDRPSTLRKHLLVHTGEKAFVCDICGRRFGVASNLNRHTRRCVLRPVNSTMGTATTSPAIAYAPVTATAADSIVSSTSLSQPTAVASHSGPSRPTDNPPVAGPSNGKGKRKRVRTPSPAAGASSSLPSHGDASPETTNKLPKSPQKRRRRAPSPSQWIPQSLLAFELYPVEFTKSTPVPLPPVSPYKSEWVEEERDSWDDNVGDLPYHPSAWKGRLPGPGFGLGFGVGFGGRDVGTLEGAGSAGFVMGRLVLF